MQNGRNVSAGEAHLLCSVLAFIVLPIFGALAAGSRTAADPAKVVGPNACAECHKQEVAAWKGSHHFKTFREMPRNRKAKEIAKNMGVRRVKSKSLCLNCHFTVQQKDNKPRAISGISCESCHSAAKDWVKVHSSYSGKKANTETKAEAKVRWKRAESKGMIRRKSLYRLAKNCYGCHVVAQEDLVNKGGHKAGSAFELVSWSQGEVRHNTWYSKGKQNVPANAGRKRMLYLVGLGVELEVGLRAIARAKSRKYYAFAMAKRVDVARKKLSVAAGAVPSVPEIAKMIELAHSAGLKLNNEASLVAAADGIAELLAGVVSKYDGRKLDGLDKLIPPPNKFKGTARTARDAK